MLTIRSPLTTPLDKLLVNLAACPTTRTPVALLTTGSFNPVHNEHINIHRRARIALEATHPSLCVVASFVSPSSDEYVGDKMRRQGRKDTFIPFADRCRLIDAATVEDPVIAMDQVDINH